MSRIFCLDVGSSSVKFALYEMDGNNEHLIVYRSIETHDAPMGEIYPMIGREVQRAGGNLDAVGHRIVYGGNRPEPVLATLDEMHDLKRYIALDPLHQAPQLQAVEKLQQEYPVPHFLCFDTAFFYQMPALARCIPLPVANDEFVRRYGFHGLSYEYIVSELGDALSGNAIIAHLGNGASMCALRDGKPIETTMGFTPLGGLMMGTRPGDLDPGVILYLLDKGFTRDQLTDLLYRESGLLGISGISPDMRVLLDRAATNERAAFAIELFIYHVLRQLGGLIAVLGGLDTLVFTGGIGENAATIRDRIVERLTFLGPRPATRVIHTDENLMIARHVAQLLHLNVLKGA